MIEPTLFISVGALMIAAAVYDAATLTIPNWISLVLVVLFMPIAMIAGLSWSDVGAHVGVGVAALAGGVALFALRAIGGGDAKLFAAIALYAGAGWFVPYLFAVAIAGGVLAMAIYAIRSAAPYVTMLRPQWAGHLTAAGAGIPYGIAIAMGGLSVLPTTHLFAAAAS